MRFNMIGIFLLVVVTALSAIYWKVDQDFFNEKLQWNEAQSRSELSALTRSVQSELEGFAQILDLTLPSLRESKKDYNHDQVYSNFQMISTLQAGASSGEIALEQKYFLQGSEVKSWAPTYVTLALQGMHFQTNGNGETQNLLVTILDPKRRPWLLFVTTSRVTQKQYAAVMSADALQGIIDRQKGQLSTLAILNRQAQVLGHTTSEYIGSLLKDDPLAQDFIKSGNGSGSGLFKAQGERIQGFYEQVEGTNLFVTVSTPLRVLMADRGKIKTKFVFMGLGISLLGIAMLMLMGGGSAETLGTTASVTTPVKAPLPVPAQATAAAAAATLASVTSVKKPELKLVNPVPAPPVPHQKSKSDEKFASLFSDRKLEETFAMIDQLDSPPQPPPYSPNETSDTEETSLTEVSESTVLTAVPTAPPIFGQPSQVEVKIRLNRKTSKLDDLEFEVRRPGKPSPSGEIS